MNHEFGSVRSGLIDGFADLVLAGLSGFGWVGGIVGFDLG